MLQAYQPSYSRFLNDASCSTWVLCVMSLCFVLGCDDDTASDRPVAGEVTSGAEVGGSRGGMQSGGDLSGDQAGDSAGGQAGDSAGDSSGDSAGMSSRDVNYTAIKLNEIVPRGEPFDWVEVFNSSDEEVDLSGCGLSDDPTDLARYILPQGAESLVPPQGFAVFALSADTTGFALGGDELVVLSTPTGEQIDLVDYDQDSAPAGTSYGRIPDGSGEWRTLYEPTPAAANSEEGAPVCGDMICDPLEVCPEDCIICGDSICDDEEVCAEDCAQCGDGLCDEGEVCDLDCVDVTCGDGLCSTGETCEVDCNVAFSIVINEVIAAGAPDGVELVNLGDTPIDLSVFTLTDDPAQPLRGRLSGVLEVGAYLWVEVSDETLGFRLGGDEEVYLFHQSGVLVDRVDWEEGDAPEGESYRRVPDRTGEFVRGSATPGAPNE